GMDGTAVEALTTWDPDGAGPMPPVLIVGGLFKVAGNTLPNNIAAWDGTQWSPLGDGVNSIVWALTVYKGKLIAAGSFTKAGGNDASSIAQWDGTTWQPLG